MKYFHLFKQLDGMISLNTTKGGLKMKKRLLAGLAVCLLTLGLVSNASAAPVTLVDQGSQWQYTTLSFDLWPSMNAPYSSVNWTTAASWSTGNAPFGNSTYQTTYWTAGTDLALLQTFNVSGLVAGSATLNVASDNGFIIFLNGTQIANKNAEGYTNYWEYTLPVSGSLFSTGVNELAVLAEDHGGATCFDMKLTADVRPVPLPAAVVLFGTGLAGLAGTRLRRKKL
jgi:hypothetical protein